MALIPCPDCGREISTQAPSCPHCGRPIVTGAPSPPRPSTAPTKKHTPAITVLLIILGALALIGGGLWFLGWIMDSIVPPLDQAQANARATQMLLSIMLMVGGTISIGIGLFAKALINK
jgi:hypothetical protein